MDVYGIDAKLANVARPMQPAVKTVNRKLFHHHNMARPETGQPY